MELGRPAQPELPGLKDRRDPPAPQELRVPRDRKAQQEQLARLDLKVPLEQPARQAQLDLRGQPVQLGPLVQQGPPMSPAA